MVLIKVDEVSAALTYVGISRKGNSTADPVWEILRVTTTRHAVDVESVLDKSAGNAVWDDRTTYNYG